MKTVLILGGGVMQLPAVRIAAAKGWRVVVADANADVPARPLCSQFARVDLKDKDGMVALAQSLKANGGLDGVFTAGTDFSSTVAWVGERLGLPGIAYQSAMRCTDKLLMRECLRDAGVPAPRFAGWDGTGDPAAAASSLGFPVVVKPVDNMGARGVVRVNDDAALRAACTAALKLSRSGHVIVEEYMQGAELSLDAIVYKGEISVCGVADRHIRFEPYFVEMGHTMPTALGPEKREAVEGVFCSGIKALGIDNGAAKGDIKLTPEGPKVGEIAARLSGGYMSGWTFPFSSGVEVTEAALNIAVGLPPGDTSPRSSFVSAERAFISAPGVVREVKGLEGARGAKGIREIFVRVAPGQRVVFPTNNVEKCGNVISVAASRQEAITAAQAACARIALRLSPCTAETDEFLFGRQADARSAFGLDSAKNRKALAAMPVYNGKPLLMDPALPIPILGLPEPEVEEGTDWHGRSFAASLRAVRDTGLVSLDAAVGAQFALGSAFWVAFLRAGEQGAVYVIESVRESRSWLERICERLGF